MIKVTFDIPDDVWIQAETKAKREDKGLLVIVTKALQSYVSES